MADRQDSSSRQGLARSFDSVESAEAFECRVCNGVPDILFKVAPCGHTLCERCVNVASQCCGVCSHTPATFVGCPELSPIILRHLAFICRYAPPCDFRTKDAEAARSHVCESLVKQWHDRYPEIPRERVVKILLSSIKASEATGEAQSAQSLNLTFEAVLESLPRSAASVTVVAPSRSPTGEGIRVAGRFIPTSLLVRNRCVPWALQNPHAVARWCLHFAACSMVEACAFAHPIAGYVVADGFPVEETKLVQNVGLQKARMNPHGLVCQTTSTHDATTCPQLHFRSQKDAEAHSLNSTPVQHAPHPPPPPSYPAPPSYGYGTAPPPPTFPFTAPPGILPFAHSHHHHHHLHLQQPHHQHHHPYHQQQQQQQLEQAIWAFAQQRDEAPKRFRPEHGTTD